MLSLYQEIIAAYKANAAIAAAFGKAPVVFWGTAGTQGIRPVVVMTAKPSPPPQFTLNGNYVEEVTINVICMATQATQATQIADAVFNASLTPVPLSSGAVVCMVPKRGQSREDPDRGAVGDSTGKLVYSCVIELTVTTQNVAQ